MKSQISQISQICDTSPKDFADTRTRQRPEDPPSQDRPFFRTSQPETPHTVTIPGMPAVHISKGRTGSLNNQSIAGANVWPGLTMNSHGFRVALVK